MIEKTEQFKKNLEKALALKDEGKNDDALKILFQLEKTDIQRPVIVGLIGLLLYYEKDDIEKALPYLKESVSLSPKSERASLGLFHALWEKNNIDEAFNEMKRFMKSSDSKEYRRLLAEINAD